MRRLLLAAGIVVITGAPVAGMDTWNTAYKRGDFATAATLLQRAVFEQPGTHAADPAAIKQLALLYGDGKGVERDSVLACGLLRAHAAATASRPPATAAAKRAAAQLVERYCAALAPSQRAAAFAAATCPRIGMRSAIVTLEPGWSIQFNDRSATITRYGESREQPLAGGPLCRAQVRRVHRTPLAARPGSPEGLRHMIEFVTVQSAWRNGAVHREFVWQLYEVRGLDLDLAAVQRWQEPGSAWPAPELPVRLADGATFTVRGSGQIDYEIPDDPPRRGSVAPTTRRSAARR